MKKLVVPLVIIAVLVGAYFLVAGVIDAKAKAVAQRLERAGRSVEVTDLPKLFDGGSTDAAAVYREAAKQFTKDDRERLAGFDTLGWRTDPAGLAALRKEKAAALGLILKASRMGPANFGMDYQNGMNAKLCGILPEFQCGRRLLSIEARALAAEGKPDSALGMLEASVRLAHAFAEPILIYSLVEILGLDSVLAQAARIAPSASPAAIERLAVAIGGLDPDAEFAGAIQGEDAWVRGALRSGQQFIVAGDDGGGQSATLALRFLPLRRFAEWKQLQAEEQQLAFAGKPWYQGLPLLEEHERTFAFADSRPLARLARFCVLNSRVYYLRIERNSAMRDVALAAISIEGEKRRTGKLPAELNPSLPVDRFTGKPYGYKATPDGFVVYSAGSDGEDNGGDAERTWRLT